ncbi:MAG: RNA polymerase sigma factor [Clostridia bacterium]|nr:RNA polymerase sigma factor [Clostridia bacterium]
MEDPSIVELYLARDEAAIDATAKKYGPRLRTLAARITDDDLTAEECENDTYIEAWNRIPPNEPKDYLFAFLAAITRHIALNRIRDRNRKKRSARLCALTDELEDCLPTPDGIEHLADAITQKAVIDRFLSSLDADKRYIFLRRYWYMDSIADIARRCGYSESRIKSVLFRCRGELKKLLEKEGYTI